MDLFEQEGFDGFEPGRNGIFILFPDGDAVVDGAGDGGARAWSGLSWYTPLKGVHPADPYGRWTFLADGATAGNGKVENWFELLDSWFDDRSSGPGGLNRYSW